MLKSTDVFSILYIHSKQFPKLKGIKVNNLRPGIFLLLFLLLNFTVAADKLDDLKTEEVAALSENEESVEILPLEPLIPYNSASDDATPPDSRAGFH